MVEVFEVMLDDGTPMGVMTKCEFDYWKSQGVVGDDQRLGRIVTYEPASCDEKRKKAWGVQ
jgi:hypothetical protein